MEEERPRSFAEQDIDNTMDTVRDDPVREELLRYARIFKSSWIDLASVLSKVAKEKHYEAWGYKSLEAYCLKELHIRKATVSKLIGNYHFLQRQEPELLKKNEQEELPEYDSLTPLAQAHDRGQLSQDSYERLKEGALNRGYTAATLQKKIKEEQPEDPEKEATLLRRRIKNLVDSLRTLLEKEDGVPTEVQAALETIGRFAEEKGKTGEA